MCMVCLNIFRSRGCSCLHSAYVGFGSCWWRRMLRLQFHLRQDYMKTNGRRGLVPEMQTRAAMVRIRA